MSKFQVSTSSGFGIISDLITFQAKNYRFFCLNSQPRDLGSPKFGTQVAFINCYVESKFQLSRFYHLLVISKSILICQNSRVKPMVLRARAKSQLPVLNRLTDIFAFGKFYYDVMVRYQNLTWKPELFQAPWAWARVWCIYPLNPPLAGPGYMLSKWFTMRFTLDIFFWRV